MAFWWSQETEDLLVQMWKERKNLYNVGSPAYHNKAMLGMLKFQVFLPQIKYDNLEKSQKIVLCVTESIEITYDMIGSNHRAIFCLVGS